jgi:hypothetical protein
MTPVARSQAEEVQDIPQAEPAKVEPVKAEPTFCFIKFRMVSTAMQIPMQYIYFSQILLFAFLSVSLVFRLIQMIRDFNKEGDFEETEEEKILEEIAAEKEVR